MFTVPLPPGVYPIAVYKYIKNYQIYWTHVNQDCIHLTLSSADCKQLKGEPLAWKQITKRAVSFSMHLLF